jgi:hypothetical protein
LLQPESLNHAVVLMGYIKIARTTQDGTACAGNEDPVKV